MTSLLKAQILGRYARGEITLHRVGVEFEEITPKPPTWARWIKAVLELLFVSPRSRP